MYLQDVLLAHKELCERIEKKSITADHKRGIERITNIKNRKFKGILATDPILLESIESRINAMEGILQDLESRQRFYNASITKETELVFQYTGNHYHQEQYMKVHLLYNFQYTIHSSLNYEFQILLPWHYQKWQRQSLRLGKVLLLYGKLYITI